MNRRSSEAALRFAERRRREDEAPRLLTQVPKLESLRLDVEEQSGGGGVGEPSHIRHIVVDHAPALFWLPCGDPACKDGGHEITDAVMRALYAGQPQFEVEDTCHGQTGNAPCRRLLRCIGSATYRE